MSKNETLACVATLRRVVVTAVLILCADEVISLDGKRSGLFAFAVSAASAGLVEWPVSARGNGHFYRAVAVPQPTTWSQAEAAAFGAGGYLATVTSLSENDFLFKLIDDPQYWSVGDAYATGPWLGGFQPQQSLGSDPSSGWRWVSGEAFAFTRWAQGEPNDWNGAEQNRLHFYSYGSPPRRGPTWDDVEAAAVLPGYVIEYERLPVVITQPVGKAVAVGSGVGFGVRAAGAPTLRYQWRKDGTDISAAITATLDLANVSGADAGRYGVLVSNPNGATLSQEALLVVEPGPVESHYRNDFEGAVGPEWSDRKVDATPSGRKFLGQFGNEAVNLSLTGLPGHSAVTVSFDLFIIRSWDGNGIFCCGPDLWQLDVAGGPTLLRTTFGTHDVPGSPGFNRQAFPGSYPLGSFAPNSGAAQKNTLGYTWKVAPEYGGGTTNMDAVYHLSFTFEHSTPSLGLNFSASGLQELADESWGLDNVQVKLHAGFAPAPKITAISPKPVIGSNNPQIITINGANFANKPTVTLTWTGQPGYAVPDPQVTFVSSTQLQILIKTGITADTWTVNATNPDGQSSGQSSFQVVAPMLEFVVPLDDIGRMAGSTPPTLPLPPDLPAYETGKDSLVFITHGRTPELPGNLKWVDEMKTAVEQAVAPNWQVIGYKWPIQSHTPIFTVLSHARKVGETIGNQIVAHGGQTAAGRWSHVHLIGHSAGADLIETAAKIIKAGDERTEVHTTFLDAYEGWAFGLGRLRYGESSYWADSYFAIDRETFDPIAGKTEGPLEPAHNVDVTALDATVETVGRYCSSPSSTPVTLADKCGCDYFSTHDWPHQFYLETITNRDWPAAKGYGFGLSKEGGGWNENPRRYPVGLAPEVLGREGGCPSLTSAARPVRFDPNLNFSSLPWATSETGITLLGSFGFSAQTVSPPKLHSAQSARASAASTNTFGSPAWIAVGLAATNLVNFVRFDAQFTSDPGAQGLLTVYWNNDHIGVVDERYALSGLQEYVFPIRETVRDKVNVLGFRLEPFSATPSSLTVTNVASGFAGSREPVVLSVAGRTPDQNLKLELDAPNGSSHLIEGTTDLIEWNALAVLRLTNAAAGTNVTIQFADPQSTNFQYRFYRAVTP